jgi:stage V sporulation protein AD
MNNTTIQFKNAPFIWGAYSVAGKKEGEGPLGVRFDEIAEDTSLGMPTWEKAESELLRRAIKGALLKTNTKAESVSLAFSGDLLNQCTATNFAMRYENIPLAGLFGACSAFALGLGLAAVFVHSSGQTALAAASSHFCTAERQFRTPLEYGGQRPPTSQWTVTGAGCAIVGNKERAARGSEDGREINIKAVTFGKIVDLGICDTADMGAAMAPAAASTIARFFADTGLKPADMDIIITGDLACRGSGLLAELLKTDYAVDISGKHVDCGTLIYDKTQETNQGGSGCGCSAAAMCAEFLPKMSNGTFSRVLFAGTGALMSPTTSMQGESIPGICHAVYLTAGE